MKSNNQYYISIYETVTGTPVIGHKSDNYLLKGIAECYGYTYTGSKCDFYYLRDISHSITGITYTEFYDNNRYLQDIADELYSGTLTSKRDNYLLRIISENITQPVPPVPPTPTPATNLDVKINGATPDPQVPVVLSYADGDDAVFTFLATDDNDDPVEDYEIGYSIDGQAQTPLSTDENGEATFTYQSSGSGDVDIEINCTLLTKTYSIHDGLFYDASSSSNVSKYTISSANWSYDNTEQSYKIFNTSKTWTDGTITGLTVPTDVEISFDVKIPYNNNGVYNQLIFGLKNSNNSSNIVGRTLLNSSTWKYQIICGKKLNGTETWATAVDSTTNYNNWVKFVISIKNGTLTLKLLDGSNVVATDTLSVSDITLGDSNSIMIASIFNSSQGFYMKNILIKPL